MKTKVQDFAELAAANVIGVPYSDLAAATSSFSAGGDDAAQQLAGIDIVAIMALVEMIMTMVSELIENCPANDEAVRLAIQKPTIWQRVRFKRLVRAEVDVSAQSRWRGEAGEIATTMLGLAAAADQATIDAVVDQVRNSDDNWLL